MRKKKQNKREFHFYLRQKIKIRENRKTRNPIETFTAPDSCCKKTNGYNFYKERFLKRYLKIEAQIVKLTFDKSDLIRIVYQHLHYARYLAD